MFINSNSQISIDFRANGAVNLFDNQGRACVYAKYAVAYFNF